MPSKSYLLYLVALLSCSAPAQAILAPPSPDNASADPPDLCSIASLCTTLSSVPDGSSIKKNVISCFVYATCDEAAPSTICTDETPPADSSSATPTPTSSSYGISLASSSPSSYLYSFSSPSSAYTAPLPPTAFTTVTISTRITTLVTVVSTVIPTIGNTPHLPYSASSDDCTTETSPTLLYPTPSSSVIFMTERKV